MLSEFEHLTDYFEQGLIVIDRDGNIQLYNHAAQIFFGLLPSPGPGHPAGTLEPGDIVIIADNRLGRDDGNLNLSHLAKIGLANANCKTNQGLLAVGQTGPGQKFRPVLKTFADEATSELEYVLPLGLKIQAGHNRAERLLWIDAGQRFAYHYHIAVGHMVILDSSGKLKFYQAPGYTARGEAVGDILGGGKWQAKGNQPPPAVKGKHISSIHPSNLGIERLLKVAQGKETGYDKQYYEINGIPTRCSIHPIEVAGKRMGALLQITDISEVKMAEEERDAARASLQQYQNDSHDALAAIVGNSQELSAVKELTVKASRSKSTVLLVGESGTGKGLFAEAIHNMSPRSDGPFIHVNCAAIPSNLLESELFGYTKGAFTDARAEGKAGSFELAQGGTLFLDEIAELDISLQAKLLHALQTRRIQRLGATKPIELDVRFIAATNQNLEEAVIGGRFREDLYYRLNVVRIDLPPLRQRPGDIPQLVRHLLPVICRRAEKPLLVPTPEFIRMLSRYHCPGNVRELENILERAVNFADGKALGPEHLPEHVRMPVRPVDAIRVRQVIPHRQAIETTERILIELALEQTGGNRSAAMALLKMGRTNFYKKLHKYNLDSHSQ